jgi:predicted O-methyltransferase YrrM
MKAKFDAILQPEQAVYLDQLLPKSKDVLAEMERYAADRGVPIADREVAWFLEITARAMQAKRCLEIGLAIGYGAAHLAKGSGNGGQVVSIEPSPEMIEKAESFLEKLDLRGKVKIIKGKALEELPKINETFDLIYLDAVKEEYSEYLNLCLPKLRAGGVIIADNLLWGGAVAERYDNENQDQATIALRKFNQTFVNHPQLKAQILSIGDGLGYGVKI